MYRKKEFPREGKEKIPRGRKTKIPREWKTGFPTLEGSRPEVFQALKWSVTPAQTKEYPLDYVAKRQNSKGASMVKQHMYLKIKMMKAKGVSVSKIAKDLKVDRKTVRKYIQMEEQEFRDYTQARSDLEKEFSTYKTEILDIYKENENRRLPMSSVYDYLEEKFGTLPAGEKTLRNYIHYMEDKGTLVIRENIRVYKQVPELPYGKQMQLDFGEYKCTGGLKLYIIAAMLSASRYKYIRFQNKPFTTLELIDHLLDCFLFFDGMPEELVIDQDSIMVVSENYGDIIYTKDFGAFIEEMEIKMYVCRKADPETKGKIENVIKFVKTNFLASRNFESLEDANERLLAWLTRRANGKISQATKKIPAMVFEEEKLKLRPLRNSIYRKDSLVGRDKRTADEKALISVSGSYYSVPQRYRNKEIEIYKTETELYLFDPATGEELYCHKLSLAPGQKVIAREHYRQFEKKARDLRKEVQALFPLENWSLFLKQNFKAFPRYIRDQCILALNYFDKNTDESFLDCALKFCLENKTYSMNELHDTYSYYKSWDEGEEPAPTVPEPKCIGVSEEKKKLSVAIRDLDSYKKVVNRGAAV